MHVELLSYHVLIVKPTGHWGPLPQSQRQQWKDATFKTCLLLYALKATRLAVLPCHNFGAGCMAVHAHAMQHGSYKTLHNILRQENRNQSDSSRRRCIRLSPCLPLDRVLDDLRQSHLHKQRRPLRAAAAR
eukprot:472150-Pleurochrysis_carterae.AAC.2